MTKTKTHKWVEEIMQLGFDVAMGGDVLKSEEFNRLQQEKNYDKVVKKYVKKINNLLTQTQQDTLEEVIKKYNELIFAVGNKHDGETRHQTALRYIKQAEDTSNQQPSQEKRQTIKKKMEGKK